MLSSQGSHRHVFSRLTYSGHRKLNGMLRILEEPLFAAAVDDFSGQLPLALCCHVAADTAPPRSRSSRDASATVQPRGLCVPAAGEDELEHRPSIQMDLGKGEGGEEMSACICNSWVVTGPSSMRCPRAASRRARRSIRCTHDARTRVVPHFSPATIQGSVISVSCCASRIDRARK